MDKDTEQTKYLFRITAKYTEYQTNVNDIIYDYVADGIITEDEANSMFMSHHEVLQDFIEIDGEL